MDPTIAWLALAVFATCGVIGGAMVGWYLRGYFPEPQPFPRVRDEEQP